MRNSSFYISTDKAQRLGLMGKVKVSCNGVEIKRAIAAKHGKNGFVEYYLWPFRARRKDACATKKIRGNIKVSICINR